MMMERAGEALSRFVDMVGEGSRGRVLDVGAGRGEHALAMQSAGLIVTAVDIGEPIDGLYFIRGDFMDPDLSLPDMLDGVWASHVLEHQTDVGAFLRKVRLLARPGGVVAITVPPLKNEIVGGHLSLWNAGLLVYNMIMAGFDCSEARVGTYGYNISVIVRRRDAVLPELRRDKGDVELLARFFPTNVRQGFDGRLGGVRW